jgi:hypothetical protein
MGDFCMTVVAFAGGLVVALATLAWVTFLPSIGLLWLFGWLT